MSMNIKFEKVFKNKKTPLIFTALAGLLLVILSGTLPESSTIKHDENYKEAYNLEKRVEEMICFASGCRDVKVMITFKDAYEITKESKQDITAGSFSLIQEKDNTQDLTVPRKISGVMIVCRGIYEKEDFSVLKEAVSTLLDISKNKIYIIGG